MIKEVRQSYAEAVEQSGKPLATDLFFMALILARPDRTISKVLMPTTPTPAER